jgi:hypothetical protein
MTTMTSTTQARFQNELALSYFLHLDDLKVARTCVVKRDPLCPDTVTHMTTQHFSEINPTNEERYPSTTPM